MRTSPQPVKETKLDDPHGKVNSGFGSNTLFVIDLERFDR